MTASTRRRLTVCFVLGLVTLPAEALLLPIARARDPRVAAAEWAATLSQEQLQTAATQIEDYPYLYRRAIMGLLSADVRAAVWQGHFRKYLANHPELNDAQRALIDETIAIATPDVFNGAPSEDAKAAIGRLFNDARSLLGPTATGELFVTLGPKQVAMSASSLLPWSERLANFVRSWEVSARSDDDCNCSTTYDTCDLEPDPWLECSELYSCIPDTTWPMCGPFWAWACNGWCRIIIIG